MRVEVKKSGDDAKKWGLYVDGREIASGKLHCDAVLNAKLLVAAMERAGVTPEFAAETPTTDSVVEP